MHAYLKLITSLLNSLKPCQNQKAYQTDISKFQQNKLWFSFFFSNKKCVLLFTFNT
jgi:hypothetical protein